VRHFQRRDSHVGAGPTATRVIHRAVRGREPPAVCCREIRVRPVDVGFGARFRGGSCLPAGLGPSRPLTCCCAPGSFCCSQEGWGPGDRLGSIGDGPCERSSKNSSRCRAAARYGPLRRRAPQEGRRHAMAQCRDPRSACRAATKARPMLSHERLASGRPVGGERSRTAFRSSCPKAAMACGEAAGSRFDGGGLGRRLRVSLGQREDSRKRCRIHLGEIWRANYAVLEHVLENRNRVNNALCEWWTVATTSCRNICWATRLLWRLPSGAGLRNDIRRGPHPKVGAHAASARPVAARPRVAGDVLRHGQAAAAAPAILRRRIVRKVTLSVRIPILTATSRRRTQHGVMGRSSTVAVSSSSHDGRSIPDSSSAARPPASTLRALMRIETLGYRCEPLEQRHTALPSGWMSRSWRRIHSRGLAPWNHRFFH